MAPSTLLYEGYWHLGTHMDGSSSVTHHRIIVPFFHARARARASALWPKQREASRVYSGADILRIALPVKPSSDYLLASPLTFPHRLRRTGRRYNYDKVGGVYTGTWAIRASIQGCRAHVQVCLCTRRANSNWVGQGRERRSLAP